MTLALHLISLGLSFQLCNMIEFNQILSFKKNKNQKQTLFIYREREHWRKDSGRESSSRLPAKCGAWLWAWSLDPWDNDLRWNQEPGAPQSTELPRKPSTRLFSKVSSRLLWVPHFSSQYIRGGKAGRNRKVVFRVPSNSCLFHYKYARELWNGQFELITSSAYPGRFALILFHLYLLLCVKSL